MEFSTIIDLTGKLGKISSKNERVLTIGLPILQLKNFIGLTICFSCAINQSDEVFVLEQNCQNQSSQVQKMVSPKTI